MVVKVAHHMCGVTNSVFRELNAQLNVAFVSVILLVVCPPALSDALNVGGSLGGLPLTLHCALSEETLHICSSFRVCVSQRLRCDAVLYAYCCEPCKTGSMTLGRCGLVSVATVTDKQHIEIG